MELSARRRFPPLYGEIFRRICFSSRMSRLKKGEQELKRAALQLLFARRVLKMLFKIGMSLEHLLIAQS